MHDKLLYAMSPLGTLVATAEVRGEGTGAESTIKITEMAQGGGISSFTDHCTVTAMGFIAVEVQPEHVVCFLAYGTAEGDLCILDKDKTLYCCKTSGKVLGIKVKSIVFWNYFLNYISLSCNLQDELYCLCEDGTLYVYAMQDLLPLLLSSQFPWWETNEGAWSPQEPPGVVELTKWKLSIKGRSALVLNEMRDFDAVLQIGGSFLDILSDNRYGRFLVLGGCGTALCYFNFSKSGDEASYSKLLKNVTGKLYNKTKSVLSSGLKKIRFFTAFSETEEVKELLPEQRKSIDINSQGAFRDSERYIERVYVSHSSKYILTCDNIGRVILWDAELFITLYIHKGYRDAEVGWLFNHLDKSTHYAIYLPRRGILEVRDVGNANRKVFACSIGYNYRLLSTHGVCRTSLKTPSANSPILVSPLLLHHPVLQNFVPITAQSLGSLKEILLAFRRELNALERGPIEFGGEAERDSDSNKDSNEESCCSVDEEMDEADSILQLVKPDELLNKLRITTSSHSLFHVASEIKSPPYTIPFCVEVIVISIDKLKQASTDIESFEAGAVRQLRNRKALFEVYFAVNDARRGSVGPASEAERAPEPAWASIVPTEQDFMFVKEFLEVHGEKGNGITSLFSETVEDFIGHFNWQQAEEGSMDVNIAPCVLNTILGTKFIKTKSSEEYRQFVGHIFTKLNFEPEKALSLITAYLLQFSRDDYRACNVQHITALLTHYCELIYSDNKKSGAPNDSIVRPFVEETHRSEAPQPTLILCILAFHQAFKQSRRMDSSSVASNAQHCTGLALAVCDVRQFMALQQQPRFYTLHTLMNAQSMPYILSAKHCDDCITSSKVLIKPTPNGNILGYEASTEDCTSPFIDLLAASCSAVRTYSTMPTNLIDFLCARCPHDSRSGAAFAFAALAALRAAAQLGGVLREGAADVVAAGVLINYLTTMTELVKEGSQEYSAWPSWGGRKSACPKMVVLQICVLMRSLQLLLEAIYQENTGIIQTCLPLNDCLFHSACMQKILEMLKEATSKFEYSQFSDARKSLMDSIDRGAVWRDSKAMYIEFWELLGASVKFAVGSWDTLIGKAKRLTTCYVELNRLKAEYCRASVDFHLVVEGSHFINCELLVKAKRLAFEDMPDLPGLSLSATLEALSRTDFQFLHNFVLAVHQPSLASRLVFVNVIFARLWRSIVPSEWECVIYYPLLRCHMKSKYYVSTEEYLKTLQEKKVQYGFNGVIIIMKGVHDIHKSVQSYLDARVATVNFPDLLTWSRSAMLYAVPITLAPFLDALTPCAVLPIDTPASHGALRGELQKLHIYTSTCGAFLKNAASVAAARGETLTDVPDARLLNNYASAVGEFAGKALNQLK